MIDLAVQRKIVKYFEQYPNDSYTDQMYFIESLVKNEDWLKVYRTVLRSSPPGGKVCTLLYPKLKVQTSVPVKISLYSRASLKASIQWMESHSLAQTIYVGSDKCYQVHVPKKDETFNFLINDDTVFMFDESGSPMVPKGNREKIVSSFVSDVAKWLQKVDRFVVGVR